MPFHAAGHDVLKARPIYTSSRAQIPVKRGHAYCQSTVYRANNYFDDSSESLYFAQSWQIDLASSTGVEECNRISFLIRTN